MSNWQVPAALLAGVDDNTSNHACGIFKAVQYIYIQLLGFWLRTVLLEDCRIRFPTSLSIANSCCGFKLSRSMRARCLNSDFVCAVFCHRKAWQNGTINRFFKLNASTILAKADEKTRSKICPSDLLECCYISNFIALNFIHPIMINFWISDVCSYLFLAGLWPWWHFLKIIELLKILYVCLKGFSSPHL